MLKRFLSYYKPHWRLCVVDMTSAFVMAFMTILIPYYSRQILQDVAPGSNINAIIRVIVLLTLIAAAIAVTNYINIRWGHILGTRIETSMRSDLFRHLQKLSFSYYDNTKTGHIMSRISNDLNLIAEVAHHAPEDFFISTIMFVGAFAFMFSFNPMLALIALIPMPLILFWGAVFHRKMKRGFMDVRKKIADINSNVENAIQGIREVKSFTNEEHEINRFHDVNEKFQTAKENMYKILAGFHSGMIFLIESYTIIIISGGAILAFYQRISMPDIIAFLLYVRIMTNPIRRLTHFFEQFQQGGASLKRFFEIMDVEPDIVDRPNALSPKALEGRIQFDSVSFFYPKHESLDLDSGDAAAVAEEEPKWVLDDINVTVPAGKTVALVGESGAGKSTLASLIPRFYEAVKGSISIDDVNVLDLKQTVLRENIGLVQQNVFLFDTSLRDNILFGNPEASEEQLIEAARKANIYDFISALPDGFDTLVGEHGVKLSGGQKQRVSIARVFLKNPKILIFDEATSSLDTESEKLIQDAMVHLCEGRTTIIIAHRLSTVKNADYTYVLREGKVVEEGTHEDLMTLAGYYSSLYQHSRF